MLQEDDWLLSNQELHRVLQPLGNTPKQTPCAQARSRMHRHTSTHPRWLRSFIKSIFLCGNHLLAITSVGLMTLIRFNCIHLAVRGECCTHSTLHRWQHSTLRGHKCLCAFAWERKEESEQSVKFNVCLPCVWGLWKPVYAIRIKRDM